MSNKVTIIFDAVDNATKEIGGITHELGKMGGVVGTVFGTIGGVALAATGAVVAGLGAATAALATTIKPASDLQETMNKVSVVFGDSADSVLEFGKNSASALGMSSNEALSAAGTYGNLFRAIGLTEDKSADMSKALVTLAGDLASFNNVNPEEALAALRSGLVGETEPLKRFGVNLNEATIKAKALAMGLYKGKGELTASARAQAAYAIILEQTSLAQGDFARTSDGLANSQRILTATFENVRAKLGTAILPLIEKVMKVISTIVASDKFNAFIDGIAAGLGELANKAIAFIDNIDWVAFFAMVQKGWDGFQDAVKIGWAAIQKFYAIAKPIFDEVVGVLGTLWNIVKNGIQDGDIDNIMRILGALGTRVYGWLSGIADDFVAWANDPATMEKMQGIGISIGGYIGDALLLTLKAAVALIGKWFSDEKGFENSLKIQQTVDSATAALATGFAKGFIKSLTGIDISPEVSGWIKAAIEKGFILANPLTMLTRLWNDVISAIKFPISRAYDITHPQVHGRASGGSVNAGQPYIVGEKGAELFVPNRSGQIISNSSLASSPRHAGGGVNIVLNYSPMMSLGDRNEAREKLLPFIRDGLRAAGVA